MKINKLIETFNDSKGIFENWLIKLDLAYDLDDEDCLDKLFEHEAFKYCSVASVTFKTCEIYPHLPKFAQSEICQKLEHHLENLNYFLLKSHFWVNTSQISKKVFDDYLEDLKIIKATEDSDKKATDAFYNS